MKLILETTLFCFVLCSSGGKVSGGVTCLELKMTPKYLQRPPMSEVHATCQTASSEAISSCQFRIWYSGKQEGGEIVNIYKGSREPVLIKNPFADPESYFTVTPYKTSFKSGYCNVKLNNVKGGHLLVGCKLTTASNVTAVKTTALFFTDKSEISLRDNSEEMHVKLGDDVSFELEADSKSKLSKCYMKVNGWSVYVNTADLATAENPKTVAERYQAWLAGNKCGYKIQYVTESDQRTFSVVAERGKFASAKAIKIILKSDLEMVLNKKMEDSKVGDIITATCTTRVRQQQDLVWIWTLGGQAYGDNKIIQDNIAVWRWPWDTDVFSDSRRIQLAEEDRNKNISCSLGMLRGEARYDQTTSMKLSFQAPPAVPTADGCSALTTNSTTATCTLAGHQVNCTSPPVPLGTTGSLTCREGYKPTHNHSRELLTTCTEIGWRPQPFTCSLDCGRRRIIAEQLSVGGTSAILFEFPWHVGVFQWNSLRSSYNLACGGSLVSLKFFISAAHCFYDNNARKLSNATLYKAVVGKNTLLWLSVDQNEQRRGVRVIHLPERFDGFLKRLESDIAVVEMSSSVEVATGVNVVCVNLHSSPVDHQLVANNIGTVPGWGITERDEMSPTLRYVDLPYVPYSECHASVPLAYQTFLVWDKFCAGFTSRTTGVCPGDSGGGFALLEKNDVGQRYYLHGVVSSSPGVGGLTTSRCQAEHVSVFTQVSMFGDWIRGIVFADHDGEH